MSGQRKGSLRYWRARPQRVSPAFTVTVSGLAAWAPSAAGSTSEVASARQSPGADGSLNVDRTMNVSREALAAHDANGGQASNFLASGRDAQGPS